MIILYIFLILVVILFVMPLRIEINIKYDKKIESNVRLVFIKIFNMSLNIDELIKMLVQDENENISLDKIIYNIDLIIASKNINKTFCKMISIDKLTVVGSFNNIYNYVGGNNLIYLGRNMLSDFFKELDDEYYHIIYSEKNEIKIECFLYARFIHLFFTVIANIKDIF